MNIYKTTPTIQGVGNPFRHLVCIVTQAGTAAPTTVAADILENNLTDGGTPPTWARTSAGLYTMTLTGAFAGAVFPQATIENGATGFQVAVVKTSANVITIQVRDGAVPAAADLVGKLFLSVRVYSL